MKLEVIKKLSKQDVELINSLAISVSMTISSQVPKTTSTIVDDCLEKVQRLGIEIGINNMPTSARKLRNKVIKCCSECQSVELTSKYNFKASFEKQDKVLCRRCSQNTVEEFQRRSNNQKRLHKCEKYGENAVKALALNAKSQRNSENVKRAWSLGKYSNKDYSYTQTPEWKKLRHCIAKGISLDEFEGFAKRCRHPREFNKALKTQVKQRDAYTCLLCKAGPERLDIHHIDFDKKNNELNNLATLCCSCHAKITNKGKDCDLNKSVYDIVRSYVKA